MPDRGRIRRLIERLLPWYDVDQARRLHERTVGIAGASERARGLAARAQHDAMRAAATTAQRRLERRG